MIRVNIHRVRTDIHEYIHHFRIHQQDQIRGIADIDHVQSPIPHMSIDTYSIGKSCCLIYVNGM
jgi:hypothetical protein